MSADQSTGARVIMTESGWQGASPVGDHSVPGTIDKSNERQVEYADQNEQHVKALLGQWEQLSQHLVSEHGLASVTPPDWWRNGDVDETDTNGEVRTNDYLAAQHDSYHPDRKSTVNDDSGFGAQATEARPSVVRDLIEGECA